MYPLRSRILPLIVLCLGFVLSGCGHRVKNEHKGPAVSGSVVYITNASLPDNSTITVRLVELDRDGRATHVLSSQTYPKPPAMPLAYRLTYQPGEIASYLAYGVDATISADGQLLFESRHPMPVLTKGCSKFAEIVVVPVKKNK